MGVTSPRYCPSCYRWSPAPWARRPTKSPRPRPPPPARFSGSAEPRLKLREISEDGVDPAHHHLVVGDAAAHGRRGRAVIVAQALTEHAQAVQAPLVAQLVLPEHTGQALARQKLAEEH